MAFLIVLVVMNNNEMRSWGSFLWNFSTENRWKTLRGWKTANFRLFFSITDEQISSTGDVLPQSTSDIPPSAQNVISCHSRVKEKANQMIYAFFPPSLAFNTCCTIFCSSIKKARMILQERNANVNESLDHIRRMHFTENTNLVRTQWWQREPP